MNLLFDVSPDEPTKSKRARAQRTPANSETAPPEKPPFFIGNSHTAVIPPLGTIDHTYKCIDAACGAECHDIVCEEDRQWFIECDFCGTGQWVPVIRGHLSPKEREFVFRDGRFAGLTISQAFSHPRGKDYVEWAASSHQRPAVKEACRNWLDSRRAAE